MNLRFEDLPWHDAVVLAIEIDRRQPGIVDEVRLSILWPDDRRSDITFLECYGLEARLNFGVVAAETVRSACERSDSDELRRLRDKWSGVDLSSLKSFAIETNSTASMLVVYARSWIDQLVE